VNPTAHRSSFVIRHSSFAFWLLALAMISATPSCTTTPTPAQLATIQRIADDAAYVGCSYDLADNPDHRAHYALCQAALAGIVSDNSYTPEKLRAALANLPILTGQNGALLDGGLTLFILGTGFLDIDSAPRVKAVVAGLQSGLARALARPTGPALRALAPELAKQCTVPPR
jgi:hypothetical protein